MNQKEFIHSNDLQTQQQPNSYDNTSETKNEIAVSTSNETNYPSILRLSSSNLGRVLKNIDSNNGTAKQNTLEEKSLVKETLMPQQKSDLNELINELFIFEKNKRLLEEEYKSTTSKRKLYATIIGLLVWILLCSTILSFPITVVIGWKTLAVVFGGCTSALGLLLLLVAIISSLHAAYKSRLTQFLNFVHFGFNYFELQFHSCLILVVGLLMMLYGNINPTNERAGQIIIAISFGLSLFICCLLLLRTLLIQTSGKIFFIIILILFIVALTVFYKSFMNPTGIKRSLWSSIFMGSLLIGFAIILWGVYLFTRGIRHISLPSGGVPSVPWGVEYSTQFIQGVTEPPFFITYHKQQDYEANGKYPSKPKRRRIIIVQRRPSLEGMNDYYDRSSENNKNLNNSTSLEEQEKLLTSSSKEVLTTTTPPILDAAVIAVSSHNDDDKTMFQEGRKLLTYKSKQRETRRVSHTHLRIIQALQTGFFIGGLGCFLLALGCISIGIYASRRHSMNGSSEKLLLRQSIIQTQPTDVEHMFNIVLDFALAEQIIGESISWWIGLSCIIAGLLLLSQIMISFFGDYLHYLMFGYLCISNRNTIQDLRLPDYDLISETIEPEEHQHAHKILKSFERQGVQLIINPSFQGCTPSSYTT